MNIHDQLFVLAFVFLSGSIVAGALYFKAKRYSNILLLIICACFLIMGIFHIYFLSNEGQIPIHFTVLAIAQFAVLGLAFKLWLTLNYHGFSHSVRVIFHVISHSAFVLIIMIGYWAKTNHPLLVFLLYPLAGLSVSLVGESIEEAIERRCNGGNK